MWTIYQENPAAAVRSQKFIKMLHRFLADDLRGRLTEEAKKEGVVVAEEVTIYGSHKPKDADIAIVHPSNGPLMYIGVRSQMSSVGKNVLEYYQGIVGECISLQDRFPMTVFGYVYLHPVMSWKEVERKGKRLKVDEPLDHARFAKMYAAISGRSGLNYTHIRARYDQFAYMVVEFRKEHRDSPLPELRDELVHAGVPVDTTDLRLSTFVDRIVQTFKDRNLWLNVFE